MTSVGSVLYLAACLTAVCRGAEDMNLAGHCLHVVMFKMPHVREARASRAGASKHVTGIGFSWVINSISHNVLSKASCLQTAVSIASRTISIDQYMYETKLIKNI